MSFVVPVKGEYRNYTLPQIKKIVDPVLTSAAIKEIYVDEDKLEASFGKPKGSKQGSTKEQHKQYLSVQKANMPIERARDIMTTKVLSIDEMTPLVEIQKEMKKHHIHHLPVIGSEGLLVGMISDRDLLKHMNQQLKAHEIMSGPVIIALGSTPIKDIAQVFIVENISAVPIIDNLDKFIGIITHRDILKCLMEKNILNNHI